MKSTLAKIATTEQLDEFTTALVTHIGNAMAASCKLKKLGKSKTFSYINRELCITRNKLTAQRRRLLSVKKSGDPENLLTTLRAQYNKDRAQYKKDLKAEKIRAWRKFCTTQTDPYGTAQKFFTNKFFKPDEIQVHVEPNNTSRQRNLEFLTEQLFGNSNYPHTDNTDIELIASHDPPFTKAEIKTALQSLNVKKAPGPDSIDFRILRHTFDVIPQVITNWANLCLRKQHFPQSLRKGEVVYFLKQGKDPGSPKSYRPICLLPTLGKLLEKLLVTRLTTFLEYRNILHENQFGFREGRSCDIAVRTILKDCQNRIARCEYTSLVSLDIQGAFDNVEWRDIVLQLKELDCPGNISGVIRSYLSQRSVLINWGAGYSEQRLEKGCPQGSCLGPILWLLIADKILKRLTAAGYTLYAFADDFNFVFSGRRRMDIEHIAARAIPLFTDTLNELNLTLSETKSQAVTFAKPKDLIKRYPIIRVNNVSVKHVNSLRVLGIQIDRHFSWTDHVNNLRIRIAKYLHNAHTLTGRTWGTNTNILKIWYKTIIERIILYGAGVWGGNLSSQTLTKLYSVQRMFLLLISRGYRTISTDALATITGVAPIKFALEYEYRKTNIIQFNNTALADTLFPGLEIQRDTRTWLVHPSEETSHLQVNPFKDTHTTTLNRTVYTDGSKTDTGVAAAFCVITRDAVEHTWSARLGDTNTVFQAELFAIQQALTWIQENPVQGFTNLYSDSLSGLQAIFRHRTKHPMVLHIKQQLRSLLFKVNLAHVKAHVGVKGNELADTLAKTATEQPDVQHPLPTPVSYVKRKLRQQILAGWQDYWDYSEKGRYTYGLVPKVSLECLNLTRHTTAFLTGHGPFAEYLNYFRVKTDNANCICGNIGTPEHYYYECELTRQWHLKCPNPKPKDWLQNILTRPYLLNKLYKLFRFLQSLDY